MSTAEKLPTVEELKQRLQVALGRAAAIVDTEVRVGISKQRLARREGKLNRKDRRILKSKRRRKK